MCGIAGITSTTLEIAAMHTAAVAMQKNLAHRGPDGNGLYTGPSQRAVLAHTRLAIIDLSETGAQPMTSSDQRYTISFNGEIYNYQTLRDELTQTGIKFISQSDTEVILHLYSRFGTECASKLRGMFAFVIWDEQEQSVFAARDPFGIKPLYYWRDKYSFAFASEVRAIIASGLSAQVPCASGLASYFKTGTISEPNTIIDDIKMLPAGHTLHWQTGQATVNSFWEPSFTKQDMTREKAIEITRRALESSIRAHLISDVPVGIFLSGGIDSATLVALATQATEKQVNTYSIAFADAHWNEGDVAKRIADHFGTRHTEFLMTREKALPLFAQYLNVIDQPTIDGFNTFCVAHLASLQGEKVVLSGLGGDELFAGYKSFRLLPKMIRLSKIVTIIAPLIRFQARIFNRILTSRGRRILDFLGRPNSLRAAQQSLRGIFSNSESIELEKLYAVKANQPPCTQKNYGEIRAEENNDTNCTDESNVDLADQISHLELTTYLRNQLLRDSDVTSMASGLELRAPFIDQVLFDKIAKIPSNLRLEQGKKLLIDSVPELPEWVINRPKQGFRFPFDEWFSNDWRNSSALSQAPENEASQQNNIPSWVHLSPWYRRWSIIVLDEWLSRHTKQASPADDR